MLFRYLLLLLVVAFNATTVFANESVAPRSYYNHVSVVGSGFDTRSVSSRGNLKKMGEAIASIIPPEWVVAVPSYITEKVISWKVAGSWLNALNQLGALTNGYFLVDWNSKMIFYRDGAIKGDSSGSLTKHQSTATTIANKDTTSEILNSKLSYLSEQNKLLNKKLTAIQSGTLDVSVATHPTVTYFKVKVGTLQQNMTRLVEHFGWKVFKWDASDFSVDANYIVKIKDLKNGLNIMLKPYPIQAKRILSNHSVMFVETQTPKN